MASSVKAFFATLMEETEDQIKKRSVATAERKIKRQLSSAYDSIEDNIIAEDSMIERHYRNLRKSPQNGLDIEAIIKSRSKKENYLEQQLLIASEYKMLFGEDIPTLDS
jgi:hypothetical protein